MKQSFLWGAILLTAVVGIILYAERAEACASHPCILFTEQDVPAIKGKLGLPGGQGAPVSQSLQAYGLIQQNLNSNTYHEWALECLLEGGTICASAKGAFMAEVNTPVPTVGGEPNVSFLASLYVARRALAFDWLNAANQLSVAEEQAAIHYFQRLAKGMNNYVMSGSSPTTGPNQIGAYLAASSNGSYALASGNVLIGLLLKGQFASGQPVNYVATGPYYTTLAQIEALITQNRDRLMNGNKGMFSMGGAWPEGYSYAEYTVTTSAIYAIRALAQNGYGDAVQMMGNAIRFPEWISYSLMGLSRFPRYGDTRTAGTSAQRFGFDMYYVIGLLWDSGAQASARFALDRYNYIYGTLLNNGASYIGEDNGNSQYISRALFYPSQIPSGFDANLIRPSKLFRDNQDGGGQYRVSQIPGRGGTMIMHSRLTTQVGSTLMSIFHDIEGRHTNHNGPGGEFALMLRDASGSQTFFDGPGYPVSGSYLGAANTDNNIGHRTTEALGGNYFNWRPYDGTVVAYLAGWDGAFVRGTHNYAWQLQEGSRTLVSVGDYAFGFDYLADTITGGNYTYRETWNSDVPLPSSQVSGNSFTLAGSGKSLRVTYHSPSSAVILPSASSVQISQERYAYRQTVSFTGNSANPNARFLYTLYPQYNGAVSFPAQTTLQVTNGFGFQITHANGDKDYAFVRDPEQSTMMRSGTPNLLPTNAAFVWVRTDAQGTIIRTMIGEASGVVTVNGVTLLQVLTPGVKLNAAVGKGVEITQVFPFTTPTLALPELMLYIPSPAALQAPSGLPEVRWNEGVLAPFLYTLAGTNLYVNMPLPVTCTVQGLLWQAPLAVPSGSVATVSGITSGCVNGTDIQLQVKEYDDPGSPLQATNFPTVNVSVTNNQFSKQFHAVWGPYDGPTEGVEYRVVATPPSGPSFTSSNSLDVSKSPHTLTVPANVYATQVGTVTVSTTAPGSYKVYLFATGEAPYEDPVILSNGPVQVPVYWDISDLGTTWAEIGNGTMSAATPYMPSFTIPANAPPQYYLITLIEDLSTGMLSVPTRPLAVSVVGGTGSVAILFSPLSGAIVLILLGILLIVLLFMRFHENRRR